MANLKKIIHIISSLTQNVSHTFGYIRVFRDVTE
ncbi:hypothetical protein NSB1T_01365 [Coprobacter fastidiosus NSB1 = JCM 33896]|nr:hypothetical protein NSB1T_01365 [Coprobacter fastidiosus NSB1 = JCM 33896]